MIKSLARSVRSTDKAVCSAQHELETRDSCGRLGWLAIEDMGVEDTSSITLKDGCAAGIDWDGYVNRVSRLKPVPAFDTLHMVGPENEVFGTESLHARHFTVFSRLHSDVPDCEMAEKELVDLMNPLNHIGIEGTSRHWRVRHGAADCHTSFAIPVILALTLRNRGYEVDFRMPWALPHSGDYDAEELFAWIDACCAS